MKLKGENISKQLHGWIESLKNSAIEGSKYLTGKERERLDWENGFAEFDAQMEEFAGST